MRRDYVCWICYARWSSCKMRNSFRFLFKETQTCKWMGLKSLRMGWKCHTTGWISSFPALSSNRVLIGFCNTRWWLSGFACRDMRWEQMKTGVVKTEGQWVCGSANDAGDPIMPKYLCNALFIWWCSLFWMWCDNDRWSRGRSPQPNSDLAIQPYTIDHSVPNE